MYLFSFSSYTKKTTQKHNFSFFRHLFLTYALSYTHKNKLVAL